MCDKSHLDVPAGRFDRKFVETFSATAKEIAPKSPETYGTVKTIIGSKQGSEPRLKA